MFCIMNIIRVIMYHYWGNFGVHQMGLDTELLVVIGPNLADGL